MTPEDLKNIRYKWFHFKTVPKDIVERVFTALESAWAAIQLRDVALLKIRKAMGLERDSEEDLVDRAQTLLLLRDEAIKALDVAHKERDVATADGKAAFELSVELRRRAVKSESSNTTECSTLPPHLRDDASYLRCSHCDRKSYGGDAVNSSCAMPQPDGSICLGILEGQNQLLDGRGKRTP